MKILYCLTKSICPSWEKNLSRIWIWSWLLLLMDQCRFYGYFLTDISTLSTLLVHWCVKIIVVFAVPGQCLILSIWWKLLLLNPFPEKRFRIDVCDIWSLVSSYTPCSMKWKNSRLRNLSHIGTFTMFGRLVNIFSIKIDCFLF